jgi:N-acetylglucosaminyldiphosphoundecaprenol N-acetyl-beta-D-mannosaminyltransferase
MRAPDRRLQIANDAKQAQSVPASVRIQGLQLVNLSLEESLVAIEQALESRQMTRIAFVNPDCINQAAKDDAYRHSLAAADWVFIDGSGMRLAGRILGQPVRANVNGTDLFPLLCAEMAKQGQRLFLLGARPGMAEATAAWAQQHFPTLQIAGTQHGYYAAEEEDAVIARIRDSKTDVLLVAMGAPRQDLWLERHQTATGATIAMGVGGLLDFYSGRIPRAPLWMRRTGLEWVYRLLQEPKRMWRRYLIGNFVFVGRILLERWHRPSRELAS